MTNSDLIGQEWHDGQGNVYLVTGVSQTPGYVEVDWIRSDDSVTKTVRVADQVRRTLRASE